MKCVICNGSDIEVRKVDEQIALGDGIVLVRLTLPVCSQCGERYYDRNERTNGGHGSITSLLMDF